MENTIERARQSQDIGAFCVFKIAPTIKNARQSKIVEITPDREPQSRGSLFLFFRVAINPPNKDEEYITKKERGVRQLWGDFSFEVKKAKITSSTKKIAIVLKTPIAMQEIKLLCVFVFLCL